MCAVAAAGVLLGDVNNIVSCSAAVRGAEQLLLAFDLERAAQCDRFKPCWPARVVWPFDYAPKCSQRAVVLPQSGANAVLTKMIGVLLRLVSYRR